MTVNVKLGQGTDVNFEFIAPLNHRRKSRVQPVNTLDDYNLVTVNFQKATGHNTFLKVKVKAGKLNFLSLDQAEEVPVEQGDIQGVNMLVIPVALFVLWRLLVINIIIVQRKHDRPDPVHLKLNRQSF